MTHKPFRYDGTSRYAMTKSGKIFLVGGYKTLSRVCSQIIKNGFAEYSTVNKASMKYKREEHSVCTIDKYLLVTGSFNIDLEQAYKRVERYDITRDKWEELPTLNHGRAMHSSCSFNERYAFVFCGEEMPRGGLSKSIERLDNHQKETGWLLIEPKLNELVRPRQVPAVV